MDDGDGDGDDEDDDGNGVEEYGTKLIRIDEIRILMQNYIFDSADITLVPWRRKSWTIRKQSFHFSTRSISGLDIGCDVWSGDKMTDLGIYGNSIEIRKLQKYLPILKIQVSYFVIFQLLPLMVAFQGLRAPFEE